MKISEYKRGFADGTFKQIEITKEFLNKEKKKYDELYKIRIDDLKALEKKLKKEELITLINILNTNDRFRIGQIEFEIEKIKKEIGGIEK